MVAVSELSFQDVTVRFGTRRRGVTAVDRVSLTVPDGHVVGLVGESGSGKSTLARAAVGLSPVTAGQVLLDGQPLGRSPRAGARRRVQMVFQDPYSSLDPRMTIGASIAEAIPRDRAAGPGARRAEVARLLELVELAPDRAAQFPALLSGGQRQRVARRPGARRPGRTSSSPTRSPRRWTSRSRARCSTWSATCSAGCTCRCCSSRTTSRWCATSATTSRSCTSAGSWSSGPPTTCSATRSTRTPASCSHRHRGPAAAVAAEPAAVADAEPADPHHPPSGCRFHPRCPIGPLVLDGRDACRDYRARRSRAPPPRRLPLRGRRTRHHHPPHRLDEEHPVTRRLRIADLTTFAVPEQPALSPDGEPDPVRAAHPRRRGRHHAATASGGWARTAANPGSSPAGRPTPRRPGRRTAPGWRSSAPRTGRRSCGCCRSTAASPSSSPRCRSAPVRRCGARTGPASRSRRPSTSRRWRARTTRPARAGTAPRSSSTGWTTRPTAPDCCVRCASTSTSWTWRRSGARQVTSGDFHAGDPAWSPDGTVLAYAAATAPDADTAFRTPLYVVAPDGPTEPRLVGLADGVAGTVTWTADGSALLVVGTVGAPTGHAGLLRVPLDGGDVVDLAAPLDRNVMPGGPGYPGALPQLADDGRTVLFCVRERGDTHLYAVGVDGGEPRPVLGGAGRVVAGLSVAGGSAVVALLTPTSLGELVTVDLATGAESVRTAHGADFAALDLFAREEREFTVSDGTVVHGWLMRDPSVDRPRPAAAGHPRRPAQRVERRRRRRAPLPPGAGRPRLDGAAAQPARQRRLRRAVLQRRPRRLGRRGREGLPGADRPARRRRHRGPGPARGRRLQLRRLHDLLPHRPRRPVRRRHGRRRGQRPGQPGRHLGRRALPQRVRARRPAVGQRRVRTSEMSPLSTVDQVRTPTLILHGAADVRCPVGQAQQWFTALRERGVPTRLVLYPGGSHLFILQGKPSHRIDFNQRVVDWMEQYAGDAAQARGGIDGAHWQRRLDELAERHGVPGASLGILRLRDGAADETGRRGVRRAQQEHRRRPSRPTRVFQIGSISQGVDRDRGHAAGRRGPDRAGRPGRRRAARVPARRPGRDQERHGAPPAHAHQRYRRRRVHRHRPRRRLPGEATSGCWPSRRRTTRSARPGRTATPAGRSRAG